MIVDEESEIPLFGLDFIGVVDRGTNVLEIKTHTICQFRCKYCFVSAGTYKNNYIVDYRYMISWIKRALDNKDCDDIEIHIAPYGEIFLYKDLIPLIRELRKLKKVRTISAQTNGMLLNSDLINKLESAGMDRLNISLNSMDSALNARLTNYKKYSVEHLLNMFELILRSKMELLIAPVWFFGKNDKGILDIIEYYKNKEKEGFSWPKLRLGIQNYLEYRTGRKLKGVFSRDFSFFYKRLSELEKQYDIKLKLGPEDFGIHKCTPIAPPYKIGDIESVYILMEGRFKNEYIGILPNYPDWAVKVIAKRMLPIGRETKVKFIKSNLTGNLLTAITF